ncbi:MULTISPECIES: HNH endonuclease [Janthinobacterium]|uniref:HNH endonuclease n=1 Tax=Janthinobacterium violaceinigrum TaxID=2654252 RepID=A0A6I1HTR9_9BURK|nr:MULTISPECIES: HNH endonuclease [Janthinobacterium]KAB8060479.1 HNH endonuclease [Janthinobacterium violaceinigrum]MED5598385.1 HNH endonuclease [Janthinobacterium sp. P210006]
MKNDTTARPQTTQAPARLSKGDFVTALRKLLQEEEKAGKTSVDVRAAALHTDVGIYPARGHSMPTCCTVMYEEMKPGDEILLTPPGGKGPSLLVRYKFPR